AAGGHPPAVPAAAEPTGTPTAGPAGTRAGDGRPRAVHHSDAPAGRATPATDGAETSTPATRETAAEEPTPGDDHTPSVRPFGTGSGGRPAATARPSGRPSAHAPRMAAVPAVPTPAPAAAQPDVQSPVRPATTSAVTPTGTPSPSSQPSSEQSPSVGSSAPALPPSANDPAGPTPAGHGRRSALLPAIRGPRGGRELWPWQEPWDDATELAPWEEIPIRESLADRVAAPLEGSRRIAVTSLIGGSGRTTVTAMLGMTLAGIRAEPVVALDISGDLERVTATGDSDAEVEFGASLAERVGVRPSVTLSDLVADAISYRARRGGTPRPPREIRWLIGGDAVGAATPAQATAGFDVLPAYRPTDAPQPAGRATPGETAAPAPGSAVAAPASDTGTQPAPLVAAGIPGPPTPQVLAAGLRTLEQTYPLVLVDTPLDWDSKFASITLGDADVILLVVPALPSDLAETSAAIRGAAALRAHSTGPRPAVIVAAVSVRRGRWSPQTRSAAAKLARRVDALVRIPYDTRLDDELPDHAHGAARHRPGSLPGGRPPIVFSRVRWRSRRAFLRLAATVIDACDDPDSAEPERNESDNTTIATAAASEDRGLIPGV
ncbi:MinD/ParA family ATP-binding protein, partial [Protofrankia coriariae]